MNIEENENYIYFKETLRASNLKAFALSQTDYSYILGLNKPIIKGMSFEITDIYIDSDNEIVYLSCDFSKEMKRNKKYLTKAYGKNGYLDWSNANFENTDFKKTLEMSYQDFLSQDDFSFEEDINYWGFFKTTFMNNIRM